MQKPKYMKDILRIPFFWMGVVFIAVGLIGFTGILQPKGNSAVQDPTEFGMGFLSYGIFFFLAWLILKVISFRKNKLQKELLTNETRVTGTVEKVCLQTSTRYAGECPYVIHYTYTYEGKVYHHKSHLLWNKPAVAEQDSIEVYANGSGKSTIPL